jgi:hypothetical protein
MRKNCTYGSVRGVRGNSHHEPSPVIEVSCSKCEWKAAFSRAELLALYGREYPLPTLLDHLAMPGCSRIKSHGIGADRHRQDVGLT